MATLIDFVLPDSHSASVASRERARCQDACQSGHLSSPEVTGVIPPEWSCSKFKELIDKIATAVSDMQSLMNEAAIIEATSNVKPLGRKEIARFMKLQDSLYMYDSFFGSVEWSDAPRKSRGI